MERGCTTGALRTIHRAELARFPVRILLVKEVEDAHHLTLFGIAVFVLSTERVSRHVVLTFDPLHFVIQDRQFHSNLCLPFLALVL